MTRIALLAGLLLICLAAGPAAAREAIEHFHAKILVLADGTLDVTETIRVRAEGRDIRRGIYRDIPVSHTDERGLRFDKGFEILAVSRNGDPEPHHIEWPGRFLRLYIGEEDTLLPPGSHTYSIRYQTTRQLRYFEDFDEIYWNVTGNFWAFPILAASAEIILPAGATAERLAASTGRYGTQGRDYRASGEGTSRAVFEMTRPLAPQEGLTVAVGFTSGVVAVQQDTLRTMLLSNAGLLVLLAGWIIMPLFFLFAWHRIGRDPPPRTVIPLFHPPGDLEPAAISYIHFHGFRTHGKRHLAFIAALLSLGVRKRLVIAEDAAAGITLRRAAAPPAADPLPVGEAALYDALLGHRQEIALDRGNGKTLLSAQMRFRKALSRLYKNRYYRLNRGWFISGLVLGIATLAGGLVLQQPPDEGLVFIIPVLGAAIAGAAATVLASRIWNDPLRGWAMRGLAVLMFAIGTAFFAGSLLLPLVSEGPELYRIVSLLLVFGVAIAAAMLHLLEAPTPLGADMLARIEGFKLYLVTAESARLNLRNAPQMSEELFERYLPYAAGLGVEQPWSEAWAAHLERVAPDDANAYRPGWYSGRNWSPSRVGATAAASVAAVSSAMAAAMPAPKSSSGSSGGGFSGGGGGGGGGGGW
ncbi:DUF2207 domain-containing protein [Pseudohoeflea coraliihabitans]|uniref:DUF2207 domain-containing protein n=1 Tax=Pseudohoeflea coraliihabitans TaxID=2860393 RepID=A0ABS6WLY0_9HYPH|nr:DUF2207 domain-containing protein [Pseudohoeflea sp. DP4N28-3]MBW3096966.1 DUF2207 domain-containing protein [Pseudohoeflea sp. DP4N28-3]